MVSTQLKNIRQIWSFRQGSGYFSYWLLVTFQGLFLAVQTFGGVCVFLPRDGSYFPSYPMKASPWKMPLGLEGWRPLLKGDVFFWKLPQLYTWNTKANQPFIDGCFKWMMNQIFTLGNGCFNKCPFWTELFGGPGRDRWWKYEIVRIDLHNIPFGKGIVQGSC